MRAAFALLALAGLAAAQDINIDAFLNAPDTGLLQGPPLADPNPLPLVDIYNPSAAAASAAAAVTTVASASKRSLRFKRSCDVNDACCPQPTGSAPMTSPDTASDFLANLGYNDIADSSPIPQGYNRVFKDKQASAAGSGFLNYMTIKSYDTIKCQEFCDATDYATPSTSRYVKNPPPVAQPGFNDPTEFGGAINAPSVNGKSTYIGMKFFSGSYNPQQCTTACQAQTVYDHRHPAADGSYQPCNFFNLYVLLQNNAPQGTYCCMYNVAWPKSYSTNYGQYRGSDYYSVSQSYGYTLTAQDPGHI